jgi:acyl carrier protein
LADRSPRTPASRGAAMAIDERQIVKFLCDNFNLSETDFDERTELFATGILDSFSMLDLVAYVEETAGIKFGVLDLNLDNLSTIEKILAYVARKGA